MTARFTRGRWRPAGAFIVSYDLTHRLVIGSASRARFDLEEENLIILAHPKFPQTD